MTQLRPVRITAPTGMVVGLSDAKRHCRVDGSDDDYLISELIEAATSKLDGYSGILGRCLLSQVWSVSQDAWQARIRLPFPDVSVIGSVKYRDENDAEQTVSASNYALVEDIAGGSVVFKDTFAAPGLYGRDDAVTVQFTAGYGGSRAVPAAIRQAVLLMVGGMYENRQETGTEQLFEAPAAVRSLIAPFRRVLM